MCMLKELGPVHKVIDELSVIFPGIVVHTSCDHGCADFAENKDSSQNIKTFNLVGVGKLRVQQMQLRIKV